MERLTYVKSKNRWNGGKFPTKYTSRHTFQEVVARLAAYEETGLTPEEIKEVQEAMDQIPFGRFHDIMEAEREGRVLVLPFKPGTEYFGHCHVRNANPISVGRFYPPYVPTLGVNAWLTREEAEAALKEKEG